MALAAHPGKKPPAVLRVVGRYELREKLGEGGMGVVWRALDTRIGGDVALKIMKDCSDPSALELFSKEWRALADLSHPNIVDVRDSGVFEEDGEQKPFFVMPLLRGETLADLIKGSSERLTVDRVVKIISQVCWGLQAAHERRLVHRDLKPSNIFVMADDTAKVIDFGVVFLAGSHSMTGMKGTYQYMSPEQMQMKEVTPASDLFSLGVILYESLTGRKPFACATVEETLQAVQRRVPPPVSELNPGIPHAISQVVHKCLAKQAIHRFGSAKELAETMQRAARNEPIFDPQKLKLRVERVKAALKTDEGFASELLSELESEGHLDPEITLLRMQIDMTMKQKKIRQLMESARARIEQDEIPLGLDKLREVLELDPENADALALKVTTEKQRSEAQASKWVELATTHLDNLDFTAARHAVQEALASRAGDPRALDLLGEIESREAEARRVREQKEQLYNTALKAYQNGEIDSALSRMVRLFSVVRSRPEGAVPERDAVYESFYKEVRGEHDTIRLLLEEAQHEFSEEKFAEALALCARHLEKYPHDGAFQALKIQIEDAERQKVSSYIALVSKNVDAEPDLDRRANILREACERYPGEAHFAQQLKVVRERRDLVNSIVAKARQFGERGQYSEALSQWDMLRNIHPRYPGLSFELEQCRKRRDQQAQDEEKAHLVEEIVRLMDARDFAKALERAKLALGEFPGDTELYGLEKLSIEGLERCKEANRLLVLGRAEAVASNWPESLGYLRQALKLDPRNVGVKDGLIGVLTEYARTLLETDWNEAQRLHQEAGVLDGNHRAARTLGTEISEARRQTYVGERLTEARALVAAGDVEGAYELIRKAREEYRIDTRLEQFEASLLKESKELQLRKERAQRLGELAAARQRLEREPDSEKARKVLRITQELGARDPDNPETMQGIADAEQTVRRVMQADDLSSLLRGETDASRKTGSVGDDAATKLYQPGGGRSKAVAAANGKPVKPQVPANFTPVTQRARALLAGLVGAALVLILGTALLFRHLGEKHTVQKPLVGAVTPAPEVQVHVTAVPADSVVRAGGAVVGAGGVPVTPGSAVTAEISRLGYRTKQVVLDGKSAAVAVTLEALPMRVAVTTAEKNGFVELDGKRAAELAEGAAEGIEVAADGGPHMLGIVAGGKRVLSVGVTALAGERPRLQAVTSKDMLVVASLGNAATIYGGQQLKSAAMNGAAVQLSDAGTDLPGLGSGQNELTYLDGADVASLTLASTDWPALTLHALGAGASILVTTNVDGATLTANGRPLKRGRHGWQINAPGTYAMVLTADRFEAQSWTAVLKPRQTLTDLRKMVPKAAATVALPTLATLTVVGGTPGAQVGVDGRTVGELDRSGAGTFAGSLTAGSHPVQFRKEGFCDGHGEVTARPPGEARLSDIRLEPCGSLTFKPTQAEAKARARRAGDAGARWTELPAGKRVQLPVGKYEAVAEFAGGGGQTLPDLMVIAGRDAEFAPRPTGTVTRGCQVASAGEVTQAGDWMKANGGGLVFLTPGCVNTSLTFAKPKGGFLGGRKKVQWELVAGGGPGRIDYELDSGKLTRRVNNGREVLKTETRAQLNGDADTFRVRIQVEGQRVRIVSETGEVVDEYNAEDPALGNLRGGRLGVKTNAEFKVGGGL